MQADPQENETPFTCAADFPTNRGVCPGFVTYKPLCVKKKGSTLTMLCFLKSAVQVKQEVPYRVFAFDRRLSLVCMPVSTRAEREKT